MQWNQKKINNHIKAAKLLNKIKDEVLKYIAENYNITEYEVQQFILKQFKLYKLKTDNIPPIVAFRQNTSFVHYFPSQYSKKITHNSLIMIDIWARLNQEDSPFADITWMAYKGKRAPDKIKKVFNNVVEARDKTVNFIGSSLKIRHW